MRILQFVIFILCIGSLIGCDFSCPADETGPNPYTFEVLDSTTLRNIINDSAYSEADISITHLETSGKVDFELYNGFISIPELEETGTLYLQIKLGKRKPFKFYIEEEYFRIDKCQDGMELIESRIEDAGHGTSIIGDHYFVVYLN